MQFKINSDLVPYPEALDFMEQRVAQIHANQSPELVWLLEHPPLYTAGTSAKSSDLLSPNRFDVFETGRGGEHTYHGPGQRIAYVMVNLQQRTPDLRAYINNLEQWIINTLATFNIKGERRDGRVGIWVISHGHEKKIAAIGVRIRKWVTFHGIAINLAPNLEHFSGIIPCGITEYGVTSLADLGVKCTTEELDQALQQQWKLIF